ncbi:F-actin-monooxygenase mical1-like [Gadus macrocephalus]|uniref:F-actin-monooxygenase mical1-like n=1 Tax=Gadus macrocephalus TaxID=80720 RepID=UPI0028CB6663|nr:F-actin-monooxygenase mical1-like [Gadus macrocephalus]XP_059903062.1 F-actin-monooxygenase mical1-like [Gadus macrocephalus]XP_059903070.1 F-actin-monooxygenase mical1-like [Gadus macrocephalus]XP_059903077.1 F-actin-monooxygenase mical1-like [Gadus macrocephalus]
MANQEPTDPSHALFDLFVTAESCRDVQKHFLALCEQLQVDPKDFRVFYSKLKERLNYRKAKDLWVKIDKRASHKDYQQRKACAENKCLVLGAGPCGLRAAVELALLGAQVLVVEKRASFSRNNVLHLWPYTVCDLRGLGAKKLYGRFCTGTLDHISIRQLQLILLKVALVLGVEVLTAVEFQGLEEPSGDKGWTAKLHPNLHPTLAFEFDVFISAGGGSFLPDGFKQKELRATLAIGITANFTNRHTVAEARVAEISGVARIYNQKFFHDLLTQTGIDLENIVYYKDDTHYFVMTAKKKSLLKKGVIKQDYSDAEQLLARENVDHDALWRYAYEAANFSTNRQLPDLEFATNHAGRRDVAMFDFTCMHRAEHASLVRERRGKKLLMGLVGDSLVEPFWPLGTGIARGFFAAFDTAWMVRSWGLGDPYLKVLAERESVYQLLSQTDPGNTNKNYTSYSIRPSTRYRHVNLSAIQVHQVQHLYHVNDIPPSKENIDAHLRQDSAGGVEDLLRWCQKNTAGYAGVEVKDFTLSWTSGRALCALIHHFRPQLIDMSSLNESDAVHNHQLAMDLLERELSISPVMAASAMASSGLIDKLSMVLYLTQVHDVLTKNKKEPADVLDLPKPLTLPRLLSAVYFLSKLKHNSLQRPKPAAPPVAPEGNQGSGVMGDIETDAAPALGSSSEDCYSCGQRLYLLARVNAMGKFFHRHCFTCHKCGHPLRLGGYTFHQTTGTFYCELHSEHLGPENGSEDSSDEVCAGGDGPTDEENSTSSDEDVPSPSDEDLEHTLDSGPTRPHPVQGDQHQTIPGPIGNPQSPAKPPHATGMVAPIEEEEEEEEKTTMPNASPPTPKPRVSKKNHPSPQPSPPVPKPRTLHLVDPLADDEDPGGSPEHQDRGSPCQKDSRPKQSLRKLQLSEEEKCQLVNLQSFSADSDSETPGGSSSCSSSSAATAGGPSPPKPAGQGQGQDPGQEEEEEDYLSGSTLQRGKRNRRCIRRKEEPGGQAKTRVHSKVSPRDPQLSVLTPHPGRVETTFRHGHSTSEDGDDEEEDDDDDDEEDMRFGSYDIEFPDEKPSDPVEAEKLELRKMRTLERRAKMTELQRFRNAQSIQRRLEEIEVTFKELEEKGVVLERALRGEPGSGGSPEMIEQWIQLVHEKNAVDSEESDLMVASRQLELEDQQGILELELRKYKELSDSEKTAEQQAEEERILQQRMEVVDMRDSLVAFLDEKRQVVSG